MTAASMVVPYHNEKHGIRYVMESANRIDCLAEVVVVDNNSKDNSGVVASSQEASVVLEKIQGYGAAIKLIFFWLMKTL